MPQRIVVTGIGMISSIGNDTEATLNSLKKSKSGIGKLSLFDTIHDNLPVGQINLDISDLEKLAGVQQSDKIYSRNALLAIIAANEALRNVQNRSFAKTGLISATTVGGMSANEVYYRELLSSNKNSEYIETFDGGDCTAKLAEYLGIDRFFTTINTACSSSANSVMIGMRLIQSGRIERAIVGGTDCLTKFTLNGFNTLEILDPEPCKPFDENRKGLNIGEGAAFLVLEPENIADPDSIICEVKGYANTNDAFHATASSPEGIGAYLAMKNSLEMSGLTPGEIDYINVHGTGTDINDLSEGNAIQKLFYDNVPLFSSTKAFTGHTLGAAGSIEAVISTLAISHDFVPANLNFNTKMKELSIKPQKEILENAGINNVMSNSFGFGGNSTTLIFSRYSGR